MEDVRVDVSELEEGSYGARFVILSMLMELRTCVSLCESRESIRTAAYEIQAHRMTSALITLAKAPVASELDYCNSLYIKGL